MYCTVYRQNPFMISMYKNSEKTNPKAQFCKMK